MKISVNSYSFESMGGLFEDPPLTNIQISHPSQHVLEKSLYGLKHIHVRIFIQIVFTVKFAKNERKR